MAIKKLSSKHSRRADSCRSRRPKQGRTSRRRVDEGEPRADAGLSSSEELAAETAALGLNDWDES